MSANPPITGHCYCGVTSFEANQLPEAVTYCHCEDCRRFSGAPVSAFAAFEDSSVSFTPDKGHEVSVHPGAHRSFCKSCGSPLASRYDYLPGQIYISVGVIDQIDDVEPQMHAHESKRVSWLHINDDKDRLVGSSRLRLNERAT